MECEITILQPRADGTREELGHQAFESLELAKPVIEAALNQGYEVRVVGPTSKGDEYLEALSGPGIRVKPSFE